MPKTPNASLIDICIQEDTICITTKTAQELRCTLTSIRIPWDHNHTPPWEDELSISLLDWQQVHEGSSTLQQTY